MYQLVRILCILPEGIYMSPSKYAYIVLSLILYTVVAYFTYYILSHTLLFSLNYLGNCFISGHKVSPFLTAAYSNLWTQYFILLLVTFNWKIFGKNAVCRMNFNLPDMEEFQKISKYPKMLYEHINISVGRKFA